MRILFLILILVLIGAGFYGYTNNSMACRKLGNDVVADVTMIFTPGSGKAPPTPIASTAPAASEASQSKHWQQGFVTEQPAASTAPATETSPPSSNAATSAVNVPAPAPNPVVPPNQPFTEFTNYTMALNEARTTGKPLLILFSGLSWSEYSQLMQARVISQPVFKQYVANHFIFLDLDSPHALASDDGALNAPDDSNALSTPRNDADLDLLKATMKKYGVTAVPTIVVINGDEQELGRIAGGPGEGPSALISKLNTMLPP